MPRPKIITHRRGGKICILLRILVIVAAVGIFLEWRPLGENVPSASAITASAVQIASDAVANNEILNSILVTTKEEDSGSDQPSGGAGTDYIYIDYDEGSADSDEEEEKVYNRKGGDNDDYGDNNSKSSKDKESSSSGGGSYDEDSSSSSKLSGSINESAEKDGRSIVKDDSKTAAVVKEASSAFPKVTSPFFTCPDGRRGLHVIHMPLLLGQTMENGAAGVFMAGRMIMFRDFALPSLARQSNQNFVVYVSYDPDQDSAFKEAAQEALKTQIQGIKNNSSAFVYVADNPKYFINKPDKMLAFPRVANVLVENQIVSRKDSKSVTLYLTSKMDSDDAVHQDAVGYIQQEACARVGPEESERVLSIQIGPKLAWFPHANTTYGVLSKLSEDVAPDRREVLERQIMSKPHLSSVAIDVSLMLCQSPLNCYTSTGEGDPVSIFNDLKTAEDCPYAFRNDTNVLNIEIQGAIAGALFSRPPRFGSDADLLPLGVEFNIDLLDLDGYSPIPFDLNAITGCGIVPGEISATNLLLASVYAEAPYVSGLSSRDAQGWGAVGGMVAAPSQPLQDEISISGNRGDNSQQGDGMDEEETATLDAGNIDDEAGDQEGEKVFKIPRVS
jgi:hypothetical protein